MSEQMEQAVEIDEKVKVVLAEVLQVSPAIITDDLAMQDVDAWDSLKHMELIVALEDAFGLQLSFEEIVTMQSVGKIKLVLEERGAVS
jgi:acyl carrier protein